MYSKCIRCVFECIRDVADCGRARLAVWWLANCDECWLNVLVVWWLVVWWLADCWLCMVAGGLDGWLDGGWPRCVRDVLLCVFIRSCLPFTVSLFALRNDGSSHVPGVQGRIGRRQRGLALVVQRLAAIVM